MTINVVSSVVLVLEIILFLVLLSQCVGGRNRTIW